MHVVGVPTSMDEASLLALPWIVVVALERDIVTLNTQAPCVSFSV